MVFQFYHFNLIASPVEFYEFIVRVAITIQKCSFFCLNFDFYRPVELEKHL